MNSDSLEVLKASFDLPLLTREQERFLFEQLKKGDPDAAAAARAILIDHNVRLVRKIARAMRTNNELEDRFQRGIKGLNKAIDKFKVEKKYKFSTYATYWIRQAINRETSDDLSDCRLRLPTYVVNGLKRMERICDREGLEPTLELIINRREMLRKIDGVPTKPSVREAEIIMSLLKDNRRPVSLDCEVTSSSGKGSCRLGDLLPDQRAELAFEINIDRQIIDSLLPCLSDIQRQVVTQYYLVDGQSLTSIGKQLGLSPSTVRKIQIASLELMLKQAIQLGIAPP
ncbi:MAG: sigma-70 family RNA polymerase sigma factor [Patescibacteria group bacterium]